jgi:hypothetical protein
LKDLKAKYGFQQWQDIGHSGDIFRNEGADGNSSGGSNKQEKEELSSLSFLSIIFFLLLLEILLSLHLHCL